MKNTEKLTTKVMFYSLLIILLTLPGCSTQSKFLSLENRISKLESQEKLILNKFESQKDSIESLVHRFKELSDRLLVDNNETCLRVTAEKLNIRTQPKLEEKYLLAIAKNGAFLRKINCANEECTWLLVEFLIDNYSYLGYVINDIKYHESVPYDPFKFHNVVRKGLIKYQWEREIFNNAKAEKLRNMGIYVESASDLNPVHYRRHLIELFRLFDYFVLTEILDFDLEKSKEIFREKGLDCILSVEIDKTNVTSINFYNRHENNLYTISLPIQSIEISR